MGFDRHAEESVLRFFETHTRLNRRGYLSLGFITLEMTRHERGSFVAALLIERACYDLEQQGFLQKLDPGPTTPNDRVSFRLTNPLDLLAEI